MAIKQQKADKGKHIAPTEDLFTFPKNVFNYPIFCLKYLHKDFCITRCDKDEKISLLEKLHQLSSMTWEQIRQAGRHGLGTEKIEQDSIKAGKPLHVTPDVTMYAIRFQGKKPMVGYKSHFIFHILYIDRSFTLYNHG